MYNELTGKVAVITGGSTGIGAAVAERLGQEKMLVVINYLNNDQEAQALQQKIQQAGGMAALYKGDISDEQHAQKVIEFALSHFGKLDVLINNAGIEMQALSHEVDLQHWQKVLDVNLTSYFLTARAAIKYFLQHKVKGSIINMSSVHEIIPWPTFVSYAVSKGGVRMLTQSLALEYAAFGIRVNGIGPGAIDTPINHEKMSDPEQVAKLKKMIPLQHVGQPSDIANAVAWLISQQAAYVTGITLFVDGGMTLYPSFQGGEG